MDPDSYNISTEGKTFVFKVRQSHSYPCVLIVIVSVYKMDVIILLTTMHSYPFHSRYIESNPTNRTTGSKECDEAIKDVRHILLDLSNTEKTAGDLHVFNIVEDIVAQHNKGAFDTIQFYYELDANLDFARLQKYVSMRTSYFASVCEQDEINEFGPRGPHRSNEENEELRILCQHHKHRYWVWVGFGTHMPYLQWVLRSHCR